MKKILFYMDDGAFPVPSEKGGAIEELLTLLIKENEEEKQFEFYFAEAKIGNEINKWRYDFKNTHIQNIKIHKLSRFIFKALNYLNKKTDYKLPIYSCYSRKIFKYAKEINPDYIFFEGSYNGVVRKFAKYFGRKKLVYHVHHQVLPKRDVSKFFGNVLCVSNFISNDWANTQNEWKKTNNKINFPVLFNSVDERKFKTISQEERLSLRKRLGFKENDFIVCFCGRLVKVKGIKPLISAVLDAPMNIKLLVIGDSGFDGSKNNSFIKEIKNMVDGNEKKIVFTGYINNSELFKYYNICDLQAIPSLCEEAFGNVAIEGQYCGLPQLVTNSGGLMEAVCKEGAIVVKRDEKLISNLKKKIIDLYNDKIACDEMSKSNLENAKKYTRLGYYKNFVNVVEKL